MARFAWLLLASTLLTGSLSMPWLPDEVPFDRVARDHFDALSVARNSGEPSDAPLTLRVHRIGDATDADLSAAWAWLAEHANVRVVDDANGAPLYLTRLDLAATSGRATLGATVRDGMAVEVRDHDVGNCVAAHEALHFLGLKHVEDRGNLMYSHCTKGQLDRAGLDPHQRAQLDALASVEATLPGGAVVWAQR